MPMGSMDESNLMSTLGNSTSEVRIVALAGGVGGAKMAHGLSTTGEYSTLTVVVNTADDFDHYGLRICPDLDTVMYTLAGIANPVTGMGDRRRHPQNAGRSGRVRSRSVVSGRRP